MEVADALLSIRYRKVREFFLSLISIAGSAVLCYGSRTIMKHTITDRELRNHLLYLTWLTSACFYICWTILSHAAKRKLARAKIVGGVLHSAVFLLGQCPDFFPPSRIYIIDYFVWFQGYVSRDTLFCY